MEAVALAEREALIASLVADALKKQRRVDPWLILSPPVLGALQTLCWEQMERTDVTWKELKPQLSLAVGCAIALYASGRAEADVVVSHLLDRLAQQESRNVFIARVKALREATGMGLKEAIDRVTALYGRESPPNPTRAKVRIYVEIDEELLREPFETASGQEFGLSTNLLYDANEIDVVRSSGGWRVLKSRTRMLSPADSADPVDR